VLKIPVWGDGGNAGVADAEVEDGESFLEA